MIPVTYHPPATQRLFADNERRIQGKPYARFFDGALCLPDHAMPALTRPMPVGAALTSKPEDLNSLLEPGHHEYETGYCAGADGTPYVAQVVPFPGCTADMFAWWMWWHQVEPERYTLWHPYDHVEAVPRDRSVLGAPGLTDAQRYIGQTCDIVEYLGDRRTAGAFTYVDAADLGFDTARFPAAGIRAYAAGRTMLAPRVPGLVVIHLARDTEDGFELRSRLLLDPLALEVAGRRVPVDGLARAARVKRRLFGERFAHLALLHCLIEFTQLSRYLAPLYDEFGPHRA